MNTAHDLWELVNELREDSGRQAFRYDPACEQAAQELADHMAMTGRLSHWQFTQRLRRAHASYKSAAENAAIAPTTNDAVAMWLDSPSHRSTLMGKYKRGGCGVAATRRGFACVLTVVS